MAHPGHELRVHRWLEVAKPDACVLTDGSGRTGRSRLPSTTRTLDGLGVVRGPVYGRFTDVECYRIFETGDAAALTEVADELARWFVAREFTDVVGDAVEWFNTTHDVCRYATAAAAVIAGRRTGRTPRLWNFLLDGSPSACPAAVRDRALWLRLDEAALRRKLAAAESCPELGAEVAAVKERFGVAAFATECLMPTDAAAAFHDEPPAKPGYERYGEKQVAAGHYSRVIRYRDHILPLRDALRRHAETNG